MGSPALPHSDLPRLKNGLLRSQIFDWLRDAIVSGTYKPGEALREINLAREFGVSQNTVREALLQLEQTGLVIRTPNKNTTVTRLTAADIAERVALRMSLEPNVCAEAAIRMTDKDFEHVRARLQGISEAVVANRPFEAAQADLAFHRTIWDLSGCRFLAQVLDQATLPLFAFVSLLRYRRPQTVAEVMLPHEEIFAAMQAKDKQRLTDVLHGHLLLSYLEFMDTDEANFAKRFATTADPAQLAESATTRSTRATAGRQTSNKNEVLREI
jgi:DNA-binding GntR family transcriptional regulator